MNPMTEDDLAQLEEAARKASELLRALANEYRLLILCYLLEGEKQVAELQAALNISQSSLSQHLARLRHEGLVNTRRKSQAIFYSLAGDEARKIIEVLHRLYCDKPVTTQASETKPVPHKSGLGKAAGF